MASDDLFLAFYAKTREEDLIQHIQSYHARGGDLNIRDKTGWGFLNHAAFNNCLRVAQTLLELRADPNMADDSGYTPLHWAVKHEAEAMVDLLMEFGADPNARNLFGKTPIQLASPATQKLIRQYLEDSENIVDVGRMPITGKKVRRKKKSKGELVKSYFDLGDPNTRSWYQKKARNVWLSIKNLLANQILQLFLQILLCLLVEVFQEQLKRTLQVVLIIPFNFWYFNILPALSYLVPTSVMGPLLQVLRQKLLPIIIVLFQPFVSLVLSLLSLVGMLLWPVAHIFGSFLWPLSKFLFQLTLSWASSLLLLVKLPMWFLWESLGLPLLSGLYRWGLDRTKPILDFIMQKLVWPLMVKIAPHLQQQALLRKMAYPFVAGFAQIQTYLLPTWFLTNVEIFIYHLFGHTYNSTVLTKDKDIALVVVVSFIALLELFVVLFGYVAKIFYLIVWWWINSFFMGRLLAPNCVDAFFESMYPALFNSSAISGSASSTWSLHDIFVWWPNLAHHELGAALCIILVLTTTAVVCFISLMRALYLVAHYTHQKCCKRKLQ